MNNLPSNIIQHIFEYDNIYKEKFDKVLTQLTAHCFIYHCCICFKPYSNCYCYCPNCRTYLKYFQQIYYSINSTYEDELQMIIALTG